MIEGLKRNHKEGFIFSDIFNDNRTDLINWMHLRGIVNDKRKELRELKESLTDYQQTLKHYGEEYFFRLRVPIYEKGIKEMSEDIPKKERILERLSREYKPLNKMVKALKKLNLERIGDIE